ncbi:MAG: tRNA (adenosine(37)-N6)-threonylcarbamoyltransferase complex ATPase subunit type 1 TsaE [Proteocatella sp.]
MKIYIENVEKTIRLGEMLGRMLKSKDIICLDGDLGAGKTHFSKGVALGLEIEEDITSPTFTIVQEYEGRLPLYHFDTYRIAHSEEMYNIGFDDYLNKEGVIIIEWSKLIEAVLPEDRIDIEISYAPEGGRYFEFVAHGQRHELLLEELKQEIEKNKI